MSRIAEKAARAQSLARDERFIEFFTVVRDEQIAVFTNVASTADAREEAHTILRALSLITSRMVAAETDHKIEQKGQHRGND